MLNIWCKFLNLFFFEHESNCQCIRIAKLALLHFILICIEYCRICSLIGGKQCAEGFGQRESVTVQGVGTAESAEQSQIRAESTKTKQGRGE